MPALFASFPGHVGKVVRKGDKTRIMDRDRNQICLVKHHKCRKVHKYDLVQPNMQFGGALDDFLRASVD